LSDVSGSCDRRFPAKEKMFGIEGMVVRIGRADSYRLWIVLSVSRFLVRITDYARVEVVDISVIRG
jgi:hypothetical protein